LKPSEGDSALNKNRTINVDNSEIDVIFSHEQDYISLTDMLYEIDNAPALIEKRFWNKNIIEFIGIWEQICNTNFNSPEFEGITNEALSMVLFEKNAKEWRDENPDDKGHIHSRLCECNRNGFAWPIEDHFVKMHEMVPIGFDAECNRLALKFCN